MQNYEKLVKEHYPDAVHVEFPQSALKSHIRLYREGAGYPRSIGGGDTCEEAWEDAYNRIQNHIDKSDEFKGFM